MDIDNNNVETKEENASFENDQINKYNEYTSKYGSGYKVIQTSAGLAKRLFSQLLDFMLVCLVAILLYLAPFQFIINKTIDPHYRDNVKKPYDAITEKYSGTTSLLGTTTNGIYTDFNALYDSSKKELTLTKEAHDKYTLFVEDAYARVMIDTDRLLDKLAPDYNVDESAEKKFSALLYQIYYYSYNAYQELYNFPHDADNNLYASQLAAGNITQAEYDSLVDAYQTQINEKYMSVLKTLIEGFRVYNELHPEAKILSSNAYDSVVNNYNKKLNDLSSEFNENSVNILKDFANLYHTHALAIIDADYTDATELKFGEEVYNIFYYSINDQETADRLPYFEKNSTHTTLVIAYALGMFVLAFSLYTAIMRGYTLGRRLMKCKLVPKGKDKLANPIMALIHDVPLQYLYVILIGFFSLKIALIAFGVLTVIDIIMIIVKPHRAIRDYLTGLVVVEA